MAKVREWFSRLGITEHRLFLVAIVSKAFDGLLEFGAGVILLVLGTDYIKHVVWLWTSYRLFENPNSRVAHHVANAASSLTSNEKTFAGIYLILNGALKLGLVVGMIRRISWVYPVAAAIIVAFMGYQIYRITRHFSLGLVILTCFDGLIVLFIFMEYARLRRSTGGD